MFTRHRQGFGVAARSVRHARSAGAAVLAALLVLATMAFAQSPTPPRTKVPKEVQALLSTDLDTWMQGLAELRRNPQARELLLQGLDVQPAPERRWRLIHHLAEFGQAEDVAVLVPLLDGAPEGLERRVLLGTLHALYPAPDATTDLSSIVRDFVYLQTAPPVPYQPEQERKYVVTDLALQTYWLDRVPPRVIERVLPLKGRGFDSQRTLSENLQSRLTPRLWQDHGERLLAPLSAIPPRLSGEGVLRYRVENTQTRPLLLSLDTAAWFGRLEEAPARRFVYLKPGESVQVDLPVRVVAPKEPGRVRIDLRAREVNGPRIPLVNKLYVPLQG
jgi:hypothetical protein